MHPSLVRYIELVFYRAWADLRAEAARTYAGYIWWIIDPMLQMAVYYVIFGIVFGRGTADYVPFLLVGLVPWRWLHTTLMEGSNAILLGRSLVRQVYLPKIILPSVSLITNTAKFAVVFLFLLCFLWASGYEVTVTYLALPVLLLVELIFITACTYLFAAIAPFLPDIRILLDNGLRIALFVSGVFFAGAIVPESFRFYFYLNPMATLLESFRAVLLHAQWPEWTWVGGVAAGSLAALWFSAALIVRNEHVYPKLST